MKSKYKYVITLCAFLIMFVNVGCPSTSFGVYQPYIVDQPNMTHFYGSLIVSLRSLASLVSMFFIAAYYKKLDCRIGVALATMATGLGFIIFAFSSNVVMYSLGSIVMGVGYSLGGAAGMTLLLDNWYGNKASVHLGIATSGSSFSGIFLPSLVLFFLTTFSLGYSFFIEGLIIIVIGALLFALIRNKPKVPVKTSKSSPAEDKASGVSITKFKYWLFVFSIFLLGGVAIVGVNFFSILFSTAGASAEVAANVVAFSSIALCISKLVTGIVYDKLGAFWGSILFAAILLAGAVFICFAPGQSEVLAYASSCIFIVGCSIATVGISRWSIELSPVGKRERTIRDFQVAYTSGGFLIGLLPGTIAEITGSYVGFYAILVAAVIIFLAIFIAIYPKKSTK